MAEIMYQKEHSVKVVAPDCTYWADFDVEIERCKAWRIDRNNDTGMFKHFKTGRIRVHFLPDPDTMKFPEDERWKKQYFMSPKKAKELLGIVMQNVSLWFALDMASARAR